MKSAALVEEVKKELKKRNITYSDLGKHVGLSEAAIKRAFALKNFSLRRLDEICDVIGIDFTDLAISARRSGASTEQMEKEVEEVLADDPTLLLSLYLILLQKPASAIKKDLGISKEELYRLTRQLERLGLVEVFPGEKVRAKIKKSVRWLHDGPLAKRYGPAVMRIFFNSDFKGAYEYQDFLTGALTADSFKVFKRKLSEIFRQFDELSELDSKSDQERSEVFWLYSGIRPWAPVEVIQFKE